MTSDLEVFLSAPVASVDVGTPLAYRSFGEGPAVLLVHGWPLNGATYRGLVRLLCAHYRCIVVDLPGAGHSPWDPRTRDAFVDFSALIVKFVDALSLPRVALIGHDSGGTIARLVAAELGERVTALCLSNTEPTGHVPGLVRLHQWVTRLPGAQAGFSRLLRRRGFRRSALGFAGCFVDVNHAEGEFRHACVLPLVRSPKGAVATLAHADLSIVHRLSEVHRRIHAPVVFSWGERDPFFPIDKARGMLGEFRDVRGFHVIEGGKLFVHDECPGIVASHFAPLLAAAHAPDAGQVPASAG